MCLFPRFTFIENLVAISLLCAFQFGCPASETSQNPGGKYSNGAADTEKLEVTETDASESGTDIDDANQSAELPGTDVGQACPGGGSEACGGSLNCIENFCPEGWPGFGLYLAEGYCSRKKCTDEGCPAGSHCFSDCSSGESMCVKTCRRDDDCARSGYSCRDSDGDGSRECWPTRGDNAVGEACDSDLECVKAELTCFSGECVQTCEGPTSETACAEDRTCMKLSASPDVSICLKTCGDESDCAEPRKCQELFGESYCIRGE